MYLGLETAASVIRTFELQFVHGLFLTEDYARAATTLGYKADLDESIGRRVSLRMKRQDPAHRAGPAPGVVGHGRSGAVAPGGWPRGDACPVAPPGRGPGDALHHPPGRAVPPRRSRGGGRLVHHPAFRGAGAAGVVYIEQRTSALYLESRTGVDHYMEVVNRLSAEALTPAGTARFIKEIISET